MRINKDFTIQKVGTSYVAVPVGETSKDFHGMVRLNESAALLWNKMAECDCDEDALVAALLSEYDVTEDVARGDVRRVLALLNENHILV